VKNLLNIRGNVKMDAIVYGFIYGLFHNPAMQIKFLMFLGVVSAILPPGKKKNV
jgi:hypothetical protein